VGDVREALDVGDLARALAAWLTEAALERSVVVANSFGCQVVTELAARHPARAARLVLVGPTIDRHARSFARQTARLAVDALREPNALDLIQAWDYTTFVLRGGLPLFGAMLRDAIEERLPRLDVPVLVVRGGRDAIVSQRWAEEVTALLPQARLVVVPDSPHAVNYAAPDELARLVLEFV
jgi:pimeloyl-ACP methyl ester carboxylesterase